MEQYDARPSNGRLQRAPPGHLPKPPPKPTSQPTPQPTPKLTPQPTPKLTPTPTPKPTPKPMRSPPLSLPELPQLQHSWRWLLQRCQRDLTQRQHHTRITLRLGTTPRLCGLLRGVANHRQRLGGVAGGNGASGYTGSWRRKRRPRLIVLRFPSN